MITADLDLGDALENNVTHCREKLKLYRVTPRYDPDTEYCFEGLAAITETLNKVYKHLVEENQELRRRIHELEEMLPERLGRQV